MKKKYYKWYMPVLFALITFLCIRLVNDIPRHQYYWEGNSVLFMLKEIFVILLFSYFSVWLLNYWILWNRKWSKGIWLEYGVLILIVLVFAVGGMFGSRLLTGTGWTSGDLVIACVVCNLCAISFYTFLRSLLIEEDYASQWLQLEEIKNDKLQTELKFLKSQYHPHFLFNTLNTVYFQIDEKNELPHRTLEMLSDLLRYQLYGGTETVAIRQEIEYLETYISLQKLRISKQLVLQINFSPVLKEQRVYPLLFLPLIDNAFKYIGGDFCMSISMEWEINKVIFKIKNSIPAELERKQKEQGIGLENLRRRLALLYPSKHKFEIKKTDKDFTAGLILETNDEYN